MNHYNYFLSLEDKFREISKFVEIDTGNFKTFSTEIALVYMASCSEFEVVAKEICEILKPGFNSEGEYVRINDICGVFKKKSPLIFQEQVILTGFGVEAKPLSDWTRKKPPTWWASYNNVKHHRLSHFKEASLENLIQALTALEIVNFYYIWRSKCPHKNKTAVPIHMPSPPQVFRLTGVPYEGPSFTNDVFDI